MSHPATFHLTVHSPEAVVWAGDVAALETVNSEGAFSILPDHARFMTLINEETVT